MNLPKSSNLFNYTKIKDFYECPRKGFLLHKERIASKTLPKPLKIGGLVHTGHEFYAKATSPLGSHSKEEAIGIGLLQMKKDDYCQTDEDYEESARLLHPFLLHPSLTEFEIIEADQTKIIQLDSNTFWTIKPDSILRHVLTKDLRLGEIKTTTGYGPKLQQMYHKDIQPWSYVAGEKLIKEYDLSYIQMFIITKTKEVKVYSEPIPISKLRVSHALTHIIEGIKYIKRIEEGNFYQCNRNQCITFRGECIFNPLCDYDNTSATYREVMNNLYKPYNPEEHLHLEEVEIIHKAGL